MNTTMALQQSIVRPMQQAGRCLAPQQPTARQQALPLRIRFIVRAEEQTATESSAVASPETFTPQAEPPQQKTSWELIEEPVRGSKAPDGGPPVSQRNNQWDNLLINADGVDERSITKLPISWPDTFRFKGAAPEVINCRLAMLGAFAGLTAEVVSGKSIIEQYRMASGPVAAVFLLFAVASLIPISKGIPRKGAAEFGSPLTFLTPQLEINVGRVAMVGIAGTLLTEAIIGHAVL